MDGLLLEPSRASEPRRFTVELSGIGFLVEARFDEAFRLCRGYLSDGPAEARIAATASDIDEERARGLPGDWSDGYLETLAVYRQIAELLPARDRMLVHGAAVAVAGRAYLFCAPSGTGKTTHVRLWRERLGAAVAVVNGDKPIIHVPPAPAGRPGSRDGLGPESIVFGTPWAGKEGWQRNMSAPLAGICFLGRAEPGASRIRSLEPARALDRALRQVYLPADATAAARTLELLDALLGRAPLFELACDMSEDAVRCSFEGLTGLDYEMFKRA